MGGGIAHPGLEAGGGQGQGLSQGLGGGGALGGPLRQAIDRKAFISKGHSWKSPLGESGGGLVYLQGGG